MSQQNIKDLWLEILYFITLVIYGVTSDGFYMKKNPSSKDIEEGSTLTYECLAVPSDHIIYKWNHNDRPIVLNHHRYSGADSGTLYFDHVDRDIDAGSYNCLAQNSSSKFTRKSRTGKLEVNWFDPDVEIKMMQPSSSKDLKLDGSLLLKCDGRANPKITKESISWFFNGDSNLPAGAKTQNDGGLLIENIETVHAGFYHCNIIHTAGRLDSKEPFILSINEPILNPSDFIKYAREGSKVVLKCPWNNGVIMWSKIHRLGDPLTLIREDSNPNIMLQGNILTLSQMQSSLDAYYLCQTVEKPKSKGALFRVSLAKMYPFKKTQFSPSLDETNRHVIRQGENGGIRFYMDLSPSSSFLFDKIPNPPPKITWYYNDIEIPKWNGDPNLIPRIHVYRNRHLVIQNASLTDKGIYSIKMENVAGQQTKLFQILITFPPIFDKSSSEKSNFVNEDESLTLDCKIIKISPDGSNKIYWKKDGSQIALYMESLTYEKEGRNLRIDKAKSEHTGTYQCFVKTLGFPEHYNNPERVNVKAKLQFTGANDDVFLEVNQNGTVHCRTKGYGEIQIKWFEVPKSQSRHINLLPLPISYPHFIHKNGTLVLKHVQHEYAGNYMCEARSFSTNEVINRTTKITVGERPKITFITPNQTLPEGATLYLDCMVTGDPKPIVSWFLDNAVNEKTIISSSTSTERRMLRQNGTLVIKNVGMNDDGKYMCMAAYHPLITEKPVSVKILTQEEYNKLMKTSSFNKGMMKTIVIVVSCALAYLALIIGLTAFCSLRMLRHRRNRTLTASNVEKLGDNSQMMRPLGGSNPNGGCNSNDRTTTKSSSRSAPNNSATNNYLPQVPFTSSHGYYTQYNPTTMPSYLMNPMMDVQGSEFQHLMSAPPPTPLESRSNFSGNLSSTNSASLYTKSQFSSSTNGGVTGVGMNSMERLTYPRHELQTEGILGKGEFGDVFLARARNILDGESQSLVVVKSLMRNEPNHCHEFHRQLDLLARTESDFVTKLLGICIEMEPCLLILEYCEWGDLKQFLQCVQGRSNPKMMSITRSQKLSICSQIAKGMDHISNIRCVHKDLAARNVLITPQLNIKISHLGLCRDIYQGEYYHDGDQIMPIRWMPPESVLKSEFSLQSDVWSFGVTCWEIFALGSLPMSNYKHEEILDILASCSSLSHAKVQSMYGTLEQFSSECPQNFVSVMKRCFNVDPQSRPSFTDLCKTMKDIEMTK